MPRLRPGDYDPGEDTQEWPVLPADDPEVEPDEDWARDRGVVPDGP